MSGRDYTDAEIAKAKPLTPRVVETIRKNAGLMRWSDADPIAGSLADQFWNRDVPRLLACAEQNTGSERESDA